MELIFGILLGLVVLVLLVAVHELGHAIAARRNGVVVEEFGVGFPPRAWAKKLKNGVLLSLNWLPLGGFVKLQGEYDSAKKKGDYGAAGFWPKTKILLAGVMINWLVAAGLLTILAWTGLPKVLPQQFSVEGDTTLVKGSVELTEVAADSPAEKAGLHRGDTIVRFASEPVGAGEVLAQQAAKHKGESVEIIYTRGGVEYSTLATLRSESKDGFLGVASSQQELIRATWSAPVVGVVTAAQFTGETFKGLGDLVVNLVKGIVLQISPDQQVRTEAQQSLSAAGNSVAGPIGILTVIFPSAGQAGLTEVIFLTAIISLTLAVMNVLPIPALDGGRWFLMALFKLLKKPLTKQREEKIQTAGFMTLMVLVVVVTIADVGKLFR